MNRRDKRYIHQKTLLGVLGISYGTLHNWVSSRRFPAAGLTIFRRAFWSIAAVDAWLAEQRAQIDSTQARLDELKEADIFDAESVK
jgi:predicted DNA-binding transcriptional regulator AlpA